MRVFDPGNLVQEAHDNHSELRKRILLWKSRVDDGEWNQPLDIGRSGIKYSKMNKEKTYVFGREGNPERIIAVVNFHRKALVVKMAGNHDEYEAYCRKNGLWET